MEPLDGNAIAGDLFEHFGNEMTTATGACATCGTVSVIAELTVYMRAPGAVVRCRHCGNVVIVLVHIAGAIRVNTDRFQLAAAELA
ncbi:MAG TPA: DUF6510 family protein [Solirubrobacteraceae bacterium]|nr:DUF6510 family protein [Solirubrobacteraceae bacterium]